MQNRPQPAEMSTFFLLYLPFFAAANTTLFPHPFHFFCGYCEFCSEKKKKNKGKFSWRAKFVFGTPPLGGSYEEKQKKSPFPIKIPLAELTATKKGHQLSDQRSRKSGRFYDSRQKVCVVFSARKRLFRNFCVNRRSRLENRRFFCLVERATSKFLHCISRLFSRAVLFLHEKAQPRPSPGPSSPLSLCLFTLM